MKISILQLRITVGDRDGNEESLYLMMEEAAKDRPDVVLLPELWDIGFFPRPLKDFADPGGERAKSFLSALARRYGVAIVGGSVARAESDGVHNTSFVFDKSGSLVASYDKTHLFSPAHEGKYFRAGDDISVFSLCGVKCGIVICYDLRFPEATRRLALAGCAVLFLPAEWPLSRLDHWRVLTRARAIENQIFVAACNGSGAFAKGMPLAGHSAIIDPWGIRLKEAGEGGEIITASCDLDARTHSKSFMDVFGDRRPDLY